MTICNVAPSSKDLMTGPSLLLYQIFPSLLLYQIFPGYGGMAPRTETGKLFVLVYTIPGMLIMMSYLNIFSTCILIILRKVLNCVPFVVQCAVL